MNKEMPDMVKGFFLGLGAALSLIMLVAILGWGSSKPDPAMLQCKEICSKQGGIFISYQRFSSAVSDQPNCLCSFGNSSKNIYQIV